MGARKGARCEGAIVPSNGEKGRVSESVRGFELRVEGGLEVGIFGLEVTGRCGGWRRWKRAAGDVCEGFCRIPAELHGGRWGGFVLRFTRHDRYSSGLQMLPSFPVLGHIYRDLPLI